MDAVPSFPNVWRPSNLAERLTHLGIEHFRGGHINHTDCRYLAPGRLPMGDMGKMGRLLEALG